MVSRSGDIKVMDFGIARAMSDARATMTSSVQIIGSVKYMSPEQARGQRVDARSDLYSTGCLMYELLTGRPSFTGDSSVAVLDQHVRQHPDPPSWLDQDIPPWGDTIVLRAMAKSPNDRYDTAADMRADIQRAASDPSDRAFARMASPPAAKPGEGHRARPFPAMTFGDNMAQTTTVTGNWQLPTSVDLEIRVPRVAPGGVPVVELRGTEGEFSVPLNVPDQRRLSQALVSLDAVRLRLPFPQPEVQAAIRDLGALLFSALLPGQARMLYFVHRSASHRLGSYLRLVLRIGPQELAALPWELMWDEESGIFPCLDHPFVRYVEQPLPADPLHLTAPVRFLA